MPAGIVDAGAERRLALGRQMRARLRGAVQALLSEPGFADASDAVRLAAVVLLAKTPLEAKAGRELGVVAIRTGELGRWLGLSGSFTASEVLPASRESAVVRTQVLEGESGGAAGLRCLVAPWWEARRTVGHPLALTQAELATLLRLVEALFAPGWRRDQKWSTAPGLLAARTGRCAATDRLALLLLVLEAGESGRVRLCGGRVDRNGRLAATLARLMGCSTSRAGGILARLEEGGLVERRRKATGSGLLGSSRLVVPAVAAAHRAQAAIPGVAQASLGAFAVVADPVATAGPVQPAAGAGSPQVAGLAGADGDGVADPAVAAPLHSGHPCVAGVSGDVTVDGGFSGEAPSGCCGRPECVCVREDQAVTGPEDDGLPVTGRAGGPLRGENPVQIPHQQRHGQQWTGPVPAPPADLDQVLAPVSRLWLRLQRRGARARVLEAVRQELARVTGLVRFGDPAQVLAARLERRVQAQGGVPVTDPVGWLLGRGLPQRPGCGDWACDEGVLVTNGMPCEACGHNQQAKRALRRSVAAAVTDELPGADDVVRQHVVQARLREFAELQAVEDLLRREQADAQRELLGVLDARQRVADEAEDRAFRAAELAMQAVPCRDCGRPQAAGLCAGCRRERNRVAFAARAGETVAVARGEDTLAVLAELTEQEIADLRAEGERDPAVIRQDLASYGEPFARRVYGDLAIDQLRREQAGTTRMVLHSWRQA
ncbi:hypothetical protein [Streptacidiphilus neutrinimicus]|uniref:hypothetical protein n=1 Tax=Streptacidiphilus neutrinimicus TaxID=105420 RepID=UPI001269A7F3|nr:hypothetical protein [Streptacidiphilus neutrinimicus]